MGCNNSKAAASQQPKNEDAAGKDDVKSISQLSAVTVSLPKIETNVNTEKVLQATNVQIKIVGANDKGKDGVQRSDSKVKKHAPPRKVPSTARLKQTAASTSNGAVRSASSAPVSSVEKPAKKQTNNTKPKAKASGQPRAGTNNQTKSAKNSNSTTEDIDSTREQEYFQAMKRQKEQEEIAAKKAREEKLATMDEEEKAAFLKAEEDQLNHKKKQDRMLQRQMKTYKSGGKKKKKVGGGRAKKKKRG